jgi:glutamyl-tRNA reductase
MLKTGVVGASIHQAPLELLSALTVAPENRDRRLSELKAAAGFSELVYLATCNRVEFIFQNLEDRPIHVSRNRILDFFFKDRQGVSFAPENFYVHSGIEAARHLFTVAAALDSLVIGEAQVLGQVKEAWSGATESGRAGDGLAPAFRAAFHCAKRVRRETEIGTHKLSMVSLAAEVIREFTREVPGARIAVVGAGAMTAKLAEAAQEAGAGALLFVNRTVAKIEELAGGHRTMALEDFRNDPPAVDAVLTATSSPLAIFGREEAETLLHAGDPNRPFLFLDLAIPRDVADDVAQIANVRLWHLGTLRDLAGRNRRERFRAADRAREIVDEEVGRYHDKVVESMLSPLFGQTQDEAMAFAQSGLDALLAGRLEHLSPEDKESVRYWVLNKLVPGVVHLPLKALARSASSHGQPREDRATDRSVRVHADGVEVHGVRFAPPQC